MDERLHDNSTTSEYKEEPWTDDAIRWKDSNWRRCCADSEIGESVEDPFRPDPHAQFTWQSESDASIKITLQGYTYESDQTWRSTGLTLWDAAQTLAEHLVSSLQTTSGQRILEVRILRYQLLDM